MEKNASMDQKPVVEAVNSDVLNKIQQELWKSENIRSKMVSDLQN